MERQLLAILFLALAPLAAADGPAASVTTLTSDHSCTSSSDGQSWSGNGTYDNGSRQYYYDGSAYSSADHCASSADTLAAHAGDSAGPIGDARLYQQNASGNTQYDDRSDTWNSGPDSNSYGYNEDRGGVWSRSDERGARADALGATAGEASGCGDVNSYQQSAYDSYGSGDSSDGTYWSQSSSGQQAQGNSTWRCGDQAYGSISGHGASAGDVNSCTNEFADSSSWDSSSYGDDWSNGYRSDRTSAHDCRYGESVTAEDTSIFAGQDDACTATNSTSDESYGQSNGTSGSFSRSSGASDCFRGYIVDGPDGMRFGAGNTTTSDQRCSNGDCYSESDDHQSVTWSWGASPVQYLDQSEVYTPVWIPVLS